MSESLEPTQQDSRAEYQKRLGARRRASADCDKLHRAIGNIRLITVLTAAALAWMAFAERLFTGWWLLAPVVAFAGLMIYHERVLRRKADANRAARYYEHGIQRVEDRWIGTGEKGERFQDPHHPYSDDLDLFGRGGLFELLCTARTHAGEDTLANWLLHPASPKTILERHEAVLELYSRIDLRERLAVVGEEAREGVHAEQLAAWASAPPLLHNPGLRILAAVLSLLMAPILAMGLVAIFSEWEAPWLRAPFAVLAAAEAALGLYLRKSVLQVAAAVEHPAHDLDRFAEVLLVLERERFSSPRLEHLRSALDAEGRPPSRHVKHLDRLVELLDSRDNLLLRIFGPFLMWTTQTAFAIEAWRGRAGPAVPRWVEAVGELEALSSISGYAYERPEDTFPEFVEESPCFDAAEIGHPLLPNARCVRNDIRLDAQRPLVIVSGSNMSGKSTMLRTCGINTVLAMAGAPVRAARLRLSPLNVGASIRVMDSLQDGSSRFYAEIKRLRQLIDLAAEEYPLLFLLDELLHGTNSHDRLIGAEAVIRGLLRRNAIGLITTHDLALTRMSQAQSENVHFEDSFEAGRLLFDYRMRPGVVAKSNALELMRSVGLDL